MKKLVIHHNDPDGWASAAIVRKFLLGNEVSDTDVKYVEFTYDMDPKKLITDIDSDTDVIMVDCSMKMDMMKSVAEKAKSLAWIDHHISAVKDFEKADIENIEAVLDTKIAGCENTWKHFFPKDDMPEIIHLIGIYDTWRKDEAEWNDAMNAMYGMKSLKNVSDPCSKTWDDILAKPEYAKDVIKNGAVVKDYQDNVNIETIKRTAFMTTLKTETKEGHVKTITEYSAVASNNPNCNSMLFDIVDEKPDLMISYYQNSNGTYTISFYSAKPEVDCSKIAKTFGGGGHKGASGCQVKELVFKITETKPKLKDKL